MTSKLVVNTIEADTGISSVSFASSISLSSTSVFHFSDAGVNIGADTNISRAGNGILAFNINSSEKVRITSAGVVGINTDASGNGGGGKLVVGGRIQSNAGGYWFAGANGAEDGWHVQDSSGNFLVVESGVAERLRITSTGNIGVAGATGTDFSLLDGMVINTANGSAGLLINSSSSSHNAYLGFSYGSGSGTSHNDQYSAYIGRVGDNNLILGTDNGLRVQINGTGNMSLGGIAPVPTSTAYNKASFHIHQTTNATNVGAQIHLTTANKGSAAGDGSQVSQYNGSLYINNQDDGDTYFYNNGSPTATIKGSNGNFGINTQSPTDKLDVNGTAIIRSNLYLNNNTYLASNKGIYFDGGTGANNYLDDYEEGSWNPTYTTQGGNAGSVSYSSREGYYVKIGHNVWVMIDIAISSASGMTGNSCIGGFPFQNNVRQGQGFYYSGTMNWYIQNHSEGKPIFTGWMVGNSSIFRMHNGNIWGSVPNAPLNTTGRLSFSLWYTTNS